MKNLIIFISIFFSSNSFASDFKDMQLNYSYPTFEKASRSGSYIRFDMSSSLIGFITADFSGYAKNFQLKWSQAKSTVKNLEVIVSVPHMDTDKESRTEEMQVDCLEVNKFNNILVKIDGPIELKEGTTPVNAKVFIRGKESLLKFNLTLEKLLGNWQVSSQIPVKISALNILSPTIAKGIASFDENVRILFNFRIK